ncbi:hypothetical protein HMPREF0262_00558 [Clostridium sp. ATCC 29733]|nr:hypothetical protein HMPREF0262_00558 [Clostridium sp. ATCC 29733]
MLFKNGKTGHHRSFHQGCKKSLICCGRPTPKPPGGGGGRQLALGRS